MDMEVIETEANELAVVLMLVRYWGEDLARVAKGCCTNYPDEVWLWS